MVCNYNMFIILLVSVFMSCINSETKLPETALNIPANNDDDCDDPDADVACCFRNMPASVSEIMVIAGATEPGERLLITGRVLKKDGVTPIPDVLIYAYHTDNKGYYSKTGSEKGFQKWHGKLHGWCKTGADGSYEIHTIRPASYPNSSQPAHIHAALKVSGSSNPFYIGDYIFSDDPYVKHGNPPPVSRYPGGSGVVTVEQVDGVWQGQRNIIIDN